MTKAEILAQTGLTEEQFYQKYPTKDSYIMAMGGATNEIAFPQQPTANQFYNGNGPVPTGPMGFYAMGGLTNEIAFPQQPTAHRFYDGNGPVPSGPMGFYQAGGMPEAFPQQPNSNAFYSGLAYNNQYANGGQPCFECNGYMQEGGEPSDSTYFKVPEHIKNPEMYKYTYNSLYKDVYTSPRYRANIGATNMDPAWIKKNPEAWNAIVNGQNAAYDDLNKPRAKKTMQLSNDQVAKFALQGWIPTSSTDIDVKRIKSINPKATSEAYKDAWTPGEFGFKEDVFGYAMGGEQFGGNVNDQMDYFKSGGNWIQKATSSIKKRGTEGVCTGSKFGGPGCPPGSKRYNLAKTFRAMAKKQDGGASGDADEKDFLKQYSEAFQNKIQNYATQFIADDAAEELANFDEENMMDDQQGQYAQYGAELNMQTQSNQNMAQNMLGNLQNQGRRAVNNLYGAFTDPGLYNRQMDWSQQGAPPAWTNPGTPMKSIQPKQFTTPKAIDQPLMQAPPPLTVAADGIQTGNTANQSTGANVAGTNSFDAKELEWLRKKMKEDQGQGVVNNYYGNQGSNGYPVNYNQNTQWNTQGMPSMNGVPGYNVDNTYLQSFKAKKRLFGPGARKIEMQFRTYRDPVTGQNKTVTEDADFKKSKEKYGVTGTKSEPKSKSNPRDPSWNGFDFTGENHKGDWENSNKGQEAMQQIKPISNIALLNDRYDMYPNARVPQTPVDSGLIIGEPTSTGTPLSGFQDYFSQPFIPAAPAPTGLQPITYNPDAQSEQFSNYQKDLISNINQNRMPLPGNKRRNNFARDYDVDYNSPDVRQEFNSPYNNQVPYEFPVDNTPVVPSPEFQNYNPAGPRATQESFIPNSVSKNQMNILSGIPGYEFLPKYNPNRGYAYGGYYQDAGQVQVAAPNPYGKNPLIQDAGYDASKLAVPEQRQILADSGVRKPNSSAGSAGPDYTDWSVTGKNKWSPDGESLANAGIAGIDMVTNLFNQDDIMGLKNRMQKNTLADNQFYAQSRPDRGDYNFDTGMGAGKFRPNKYTPVQQLGQNYEGMYSAKNGGQLQEGVEQYLSQEQINQILANGGHVEYLD